MLPSCSHSQAAAIVPRMVAIASFREASMAKVVYANSASPAPIGSTRLFTKLSITKKLSSELVVDVAARQDAALAEFKNQ